MSRQMTFGVIVGNRGFFPGHLAASGRLDMIAALERQGHRAIVVSPEETAHGAVETYEDARRCAALFKTHADEIDGIIITLPNFGEERGLADAVRLADLRACRSSSRPRPTSRARWASPIGATAFAARCRSATTCASTA